MWCQKDNHQVVNIRSMYTAQISAYLSCCQNFPLSSFLRYLVESILYSKVILLKSSCTSVYYFLFLFDVISLKNSHSKLDWILRTDQRVLVLTLKFLALKKLGFSPVKILQDSMQLFSEDATIYFLKINIFLPIKS